MSIIYMFPFPDVHIFCLNVSVGDNVTLQTGICLEPDFRVSWTRGRDFIGKEIAKYVNNTPVYPDKDFLSLDVNSGSVTFIHITKELSGYYCLKLWEGLDEHSDTQFLIMVYGEYFYFIHSTFKHSCSKRNLWNPLLPLVLFLLFLTFILVYTHRLNNTYPYSIILILNNTYYIYYINTNMDK